MFCEDDKKRELDERLERKDIPLYAGSPFGSSVDLMNGRPCRRLRSACNP